MITLTHTKQGYAAYIAGDITKREYKDIVRNACPTPGVCPFMMANTMCAAAEILGLSPHGNASIRSQTPEWEKMSLIAARKIVDLVKNEIRPLDVIKRKISTMLFNI